MKHAVMLGSSGALTTAGGVLFDHGWLPGALCLLVSLWRTVHTTRARTALDKAASDRQDWLVITLPALDPEVQREVVNTLTPPESGRR